MQDMKYTEAKLLIDVLRKQNLLYIGNFCQRNQDVKKCNLFSLNKINIWRQPIKERTNVHHQYFHWAIFFPKMFMSKNYYQEKYWTAQLNIWDQGPTASLRDPKIFSDLYFVGVHSKIVEWDKHVAVNPQVVF
jgi:hypothetical protein